MKSKLVDVTILSPFKSARTHEIDTITIHCMAADYTVEKCGEIFKRPLRNASANYGIGTDGRIGMYVDESERSWCSSNKANDMRAITIEVANDGGKETGWHVSDKAYASLIRLLVDICKRNNIKELKWKADKSLIGKTALQNMTVHRWFANKSCPGDYLYNKMGQIAKQVNEMMGCAKEPAPELAKAVIKKGNKGDNVLLLQQDLNYCANTGNYAYEEIDEDGSAGPRTIAALMEWQKANGLTADGSYGPKSYLKMASILGK